MPTETIVGIVVAVVAVLAIIAFFATRSGRKAEPPAEIEPPAPPSPKMPRAPKERPPQTDESVEAWRDAKLEAPPVVAPPAPRTPSRPQMPAVQPDAAPPPPPHAPPAPKPDGREQVAALKKGLASTRGGFIARLARIFGGKKEIDPALLDQIQEVLITADIGVRTSEKMLAALRDRQSKAELSGEDAVWDSIREEARTILGSSSGGIRLPSAAGRGPATILVVGVNGVGKTTTIGKLAARLKEQGKRVVLAAGDTFRAAAVLQLEVWARRVQCEVVKGKDRADPSSVIFEAIKKAQTEGADVVIADTAGRLHTKSNLMEELKKVVRTAEKVLERPVDEILLVLDSTTGQNAIQQAQLFRDAIPISGIVLTKLDGTAKGGVVLGIADEHRIPVRFVGIGERVEDLREFDPDAFVQALFAKPEEEGSGASAQQAS
jgi:fused signal recognition particle receptor